jgi:hypothetical protein
MIDTGNVQGINFYTGGYSAEYPERLSSVTEIQTLNGGHPQIEADLGIDGVGGHITRRLRGTDVLTSVHHGLLSYFSKDIGVNGVPSYTNALTTLHRTDEQGNQLSILNLSGWDSITIDPCPADPWETSTIDSQYHAWRETTGARAQRVLSSRSFLSMTVSDSEQVEHIRQEDQITDPLKVAKGKGSCAQMRASIPAVPVYEEDSNNAFTTASINYQVALDKVDVSGGTAAWLQRPQFNVDQPIGAYSPYSLYPGREDSEAFSSRFATGETGTYLQIQSRLKGRLAFSGGGRLQTFAMGSQATLTPRLSLRYRMAPWASAHASFANYAQLPPYAIMLAFPVSRTMLPMRAEHRIAGVKLSSKEADITIEAYSKIYRKVPASTEYPDVTLHTMADMLGQQFVWLPMQSSGFGNASGIEASGSFHATSRFELRTAGAYSRAKFAGTDRILRPSNFDLPWAVNANGIGSLGRGISVSGRFEYTSGRPYTPYDVADSLKQNRPIYDLAQINVPRTPSYQRTDGQVMKTFTTREGSHMEIYAGVDNVLNRANLLTYAWMPRVDPKKGSPVGELWQMPIFPSFGVRMYVAAR